MTLPSNRHSPHVFKGGVSFFTGLLSFYLTFSDVFCLYVCVRVGTENKRKTLSSRILMQSETDLEITFEKWEHETKVRHSETGHLAKQKKRKKGSDKDEKYIKTM